MRQAPKKPGQVFWPKVVLRKWLNIRGDNSEFSADEGEDDEEENCGCEGDGESKARGLQETNDDELESLPYKLRRRNSETLRAQYINTKELRICTGTWNVGGRVPPDDLDVAKWIDMQEPADIYAFGIQEIVPLNAGNIFGAEDSTAVAKWEHLIRTTLNSIQTEKPKYKCHSDPPSPSRFRPSEDATIIVDGLLSDETNSDMDEEDDCRDNEENATNSFSDSTNTLESNFDRDESIRPFGIKKFQRLNHFTPVDFDVNSVMPLVQEKKLLRTLTTAERIGLVWPEQPLDLLPKHTLTNSGSFKASKSFRKYNSFRPISSVLKDSSGRALAPELDLNMVPCRKKRFAFVRIISKQMVGIYLSIWVRRDLRKHIQNLKVSPVGVGVMGYIGNKGSVSISMSIYQTLFCFTCCHLSSGEKSGDELRRDADVQEIHRKTQFSTIAQARAPQRIHDHEKIFWLGDLNYRIDLSFEETHELIYSKNWSTLLERDQLIRELKKGGAFDGWSEGVINFPPTYKYEFDSTSYVRDDHKEGKRNPAWCDRILWFGKGVKLLNYRRAELKLSDHRPVTAIFMVEVEIFCHRKLQKALTLTDAEIEDGQTIPDFGFNIEMRHLGIEMSIARTVSGTSKLASKKGRVSCGCSFSCFKHTSAGANGTSPAKQDPVHNISSSSHTARNTVGAAGAVELDEKDIYLKSNLKKPLIDSSDLAAQAVVKNDSLRDLPSSTSGFTKRRKVQWADACGTELVEINEFIVSDDESSDEEYGDNGDKGHCVIQ